MGIALILSLLLASAGAQSVSFQDDIDRAHQLIMRSPLGKSICRQILGSDAEAVRFHLGVTAEKSKQIASSCKRAVKSAFIYPTSPSDIRKLTLRSEAASRKYSFIKSDEPFPIESWTDHFTNTTYIIARELPLPIEKLVQILAHETAVYFDSKANPAHPDTINLPDLRTLNLQHSGSLNPLVAASDPLIGHTLTYVRALQIEMGIVTWLIENKHITPPDDYSDRYLTYISSTRCAANCMQSLILRMRNTYTQISMPLLAFSPHFRSIMLEELNRAQPNWSQERWRTARQVLHNLPVDFLKTQFSGSPLEDLKRVFRANNTNHDEVEETNAFLNDELWPLEIEAISSARSPDGVPLLEFLKIPLLSGYNIALSSGPRVRIRTGNIE